MDETTRAALTELCKAVDHVREALGLLPDQDSDLAIAANHVRRTLKEAIAIASNGRIEP